MRKTQWRIFNLAIMVFYLLMVAINGLANILPINGLGTGDVSEIYPNLFTPAPLAFSIWGLIYLLLFAYVVYSQKMPKDILASKNTPRIRLGIYFMISSVFNGLWIICWHNLHIPLSTLLLVGMLVCLIFARFEIAKMDLGGFEKLWIGLAFSLYFGWISVATIAGTTAMLVSLGWQGFAISPEIWTSLVLVVGLVICLVTMWRFKDLVYGLVFIWAYSNILYKQVAPWGHGGAYMVIIVTVSVCLLVLVLGAGILLSQPSKR